MTRTVSGSLLDQTAQPATSSRRAARHGQRARRRARRRFWFMALPIAALIVAGTVVVGEQFRNQPSSTVVAASEPPAVTEPVLILPGQTLAFAHMDADGIVDLAGIVVVGGAGPTGSVVVVPPDAEIGVPAIGAVAVRDLVATGGPDLVATAMEQAFAVRIDEVALLDDVALDDALTASEVDGAPSIDRGALLTTGSSRLALDAWLARIEDPATGAAVLQAAPSLSVLVLAAQSGAPVVEVTLTGDGSIDLGAMSPTLGSLPSDTRLGVAGVRPTVELLDGRGSDVTLIAAAACLVHAGADIQDVDDVPAYSFEKTAITFHDEVQRPAAEQFQIALGTGEVATRGGEAKAFDVTVYIGADFQGCAR